MLKRTTILTGNFPKKALMGVPIRARGFSENDQNFRYRANKTKEKLANSKEIIVEEDVGTENSNSGSKKSNQNMTKKKQQQTKHTPKSKEVLEVAYGPDFVLNGRQRVYSHQV